MAGHSQFKNIMHRKGAQDAKRIWVPEALVTLPPDDAATLAKLIDVLEDNDDVQTVYTNVALPAQGDDV